MKPPMAIVYRKKKGPKPGIEFADRPESALPVALKLGWTLLIKDSDLTAPAPEPTGEQQQD